MAQAMSIHILLPSFAPEVFCANSSTPKMNFAIIEASPEHKKLIDQAAALLELLQQQLLRREGEKRQKQNNWEEQIE